MTGFGKLSGKYEKTARIGDQEEKQEKEFGVGRRVDEGTVDSNDQDESTGYIHERREVKRKKHRHRWSRRGGIIESHE